MAVDLRRRVIDLFGWRQSRTRERALAAALAANELALKQSLIRARQAAGLTQAEVAATIGVDERTISQFERSESNPRLSMLRYYAHAVGCEIVFDVREFEWEKAA